jgi:purine-cytosine permease-like protein
MEGVAVTAFINLLLFIGLSMVPVAIMLIIRYFARKRGLDERYVPADDPSREPDYKQWDQRHR